jgi:hypothetical protein
VLRTVNVSATDCKIPARRLKAHVNAKECCSVPPYDFPSGLPRPTPCCSRSTDARLNVLSLLTFHSPSPYPAYYWSHRQKHELLLAASKSAEAQCALGMSITLPQWVEVQLVCSTSMVRTASLRLVYSVSASYLLRLLNVAADSSESSRGRLCLFGDHIG